MLDFIDRAPGAARWGFPITIVGLTGIAVRRAAVSVSHVDLCFWLSCEVLGQLHTTVANLRLPGSKTANLQANGGISVSIPHDSQMK
jgi:hypothetical protein